MSPTRIHVLSILAAGVAVAAGIGFSVPSASGAPTVVCGSFTGPAWKSHNYKKKGTLYQVGADKVSCAFATSWSKKLVRKPSRGANSPLPAPAGWTCVVTVGALDFTRKFAAWGRCGKGSNAFGYGAPAFTWFPKLG